MFGNIFGENFTLITQYILWTNDVRQTEIRTAEPLVPEPSAFEVEMPTEKLKRSRLPGIGQILAKLMKAGGRPICCEIRNFITSVLN
jgi:hypothetical protein